MRWSPSARRIASSSRFGAPALESGLASAFTDIPDPAFLRRHHPEVDRVRVLGQGLDAEGWRELGPVRVRLDLAPPAPGVERIWWPRTLALGDELVVQGSLAGVAAAGRLSLLDPGGAVDGVPIEPSAEVPFELRAVPRAEGRLLYRLELTDAQGTLRLQESLDVVVVEPARLAVLWLEGTPRFETRAFRSWLQGAGGSMLIRTAVSRDRFRFDALNCPQAEPTRLDGDLLGGFDLIVADARTLQALDPDERAAMRAAVEQGGAGALVLEDGAVPLGAEASLPEDLAFFLGLRRAAVGDLEQRQVLPSWPGMGRLKPSPLPVVPEEIQPSVAVQPLVADPQGRVLVAERRRGRGAVALSLITETYRWRLQGEAPLHAAYWSFLTGRLARPERGRQVWALPPGPVIVDEPLPLALASPEAEPDGSVQVEGGPREPLALRQDAHEPGRWAATTWPREPGWHQVGTERKGDVWFYAQPADVWRAWQQARMADASRRAAELEAPGPGTEGARPQRPQPLPQLLFYGVFLACVAALWAEEKA